MSINPAQFKEMLTRYLEGKASPQEQELLDRFFSSFEKEVLQNPSKLEDTNVRDEIFHKVMERVPLRRPRERQWFTRPLWRVAASLLILAAAGYFLLSRTGERTPPEKTIAVIEQAAPRGQKMLVELGDGSKVVLNSGSYIQYPASFSGTREVTLQGEAYFEVKRDPERPFIVRTGRTFTEVLGTTFNIREQRGVTTQVTLVEGSVRVGTEGGAQMVLQPSQQAVVDETSRAIAARMVSVGQFIAWKDNVILFDKTPLSEAVETLEQWYDARIEIVNPPLNGCLITGKYKDESLENVMNSLEFLLDAQVEYIDEKNIRLKGKGCK